MQNLYDTRPSRNEDLELVKQLQEQCMMKDNAIRKAAEDMKFYKLELINREENYNKVFGVKPVIGIFNPLEKKVSSYEGKRRRKRRDRRRRTWGPRAGSAKRSSLSSRRPNNHMASIVMCS